MTARKSPAKYREYIVSKAEPLKPTRKKIEDYPKSDNAAKADKNTLERNKDYGENQCAPRESTYQITHAA